MIQIFADISQWLSILIVFWVVRIAHKRIDNIIATMGSDAKALRDLAEYQEAEAIREKVTMAVADRIKGDQQAVEALRRYGGRKNQPPLPVAISRGGGHRE